jgi:hypothetical protein
MLLNFNTLQIIRATDYGLEDRGVGVRVPVGSRPALGPTQPPIQWVPSAFSPEVKRPGREAENSPPVNAEVKKIWIYTSIPQYSFMAQCTRTTLPYLYK